MRQTTPEFRPAPPEMDNMGDEECPACGNLKKNRSCVVCNRAMSQFEYKQRASKGQLTQQPGNFPEIPKEKWDDLKKTLRSKPRANR